MFDAARERVLVAQEASVQALIKDTPYSVLPLRDSTTALSCTRSCMELCIRISSASRTARAYEYPAYALQLGFVADGRARCVSPIFRSIALSRNSLFSDSPVLRSLLLRSPGLSSLPRRTRRLRALVKLAERRSRLHCAADVTVTAWVLSACPPCPKLNSVHSPLIPPKPSPSTARPSVRTSAGPARRRRRQSRSAGCRGSRRRFAKNSRR